LLFELHADLPSLFSTFSGDYDAAFRHRWRNYYLYKLVLPNASRGMPVLVIFARRNCASIVTVTVITHHVVHVAQAAKELCVARW